MNRRLISVAVLGLTLSAGAVGVYAQAGAAPAVKSAASISDADRGNIRLFISAQAAKLSGKDNAAQTEAREALVKEAGGVGAAASSQAYQDVYCQLLNDALIQLAQNPSIRVRLNAAIVAARVAEVTRTTKLEPAVMAFMKDKTPGVFLQGVKAASNIIPVAAKGPNAAKDPLISSFVDTVKGRLSAEVTQTAYEALRLNIASIEERKALTPQMVQVVVPEMHKLLAARIAEYGKAVPEMPAVDSLGTSFLVDGIVWTSQTPQQRTQSAQLMVDLITAASQRATPLDTKDNAQRAKRDELLDTIRRVARSIQAAGEVVKNEALTTAAVAVTRLDVTSDGKAITTACNDLAAAVAATVPGVKRPTTGSTGQK